VTSLNHFTVPLREDRAAKSESPAPQGLQLRPVASARWTPSKALTGGFTTFHFPPPTGVGVTPIRRPLPMMSRDSRTTGRGTTSPVPAERRDR
jgi:hypothetical protein